MVNKDENEKLRVAKILWPVNLPGNFKVIKCNVKFYRLRFQITKDSLMVANKTESIIYCFQCSYGLIIDYDGFMMQAFHGAGVEVAESFFRAFSWELLEAALKVSAD
jgi:hypothetical protein